MSLSALLTVLLLSFQKGVKGSKGFNKCETGLKEVLQHSCPPLPHSPLTVLTFVTHSFSFPSPAKKAVLFEPFGTCGRP
ncbi:hypothetical protein BT69DRAFT_1284648 [Atractiella rhizophila]|nr:hypothetical protein BT69DRAFT_1284648 [Atractiella rhizophila]